MAASEDDRRATFRFWAGIGAFFALLAVMLGLGWVCGADNPARLRRRWQGQGPGCRRQ